MPPIKRRLWSFFIRPEGFRVGGKSGIGNSLFLLSSLGRLIGAGLYPLPSLLQSIRKAGCKGSPRDAFCIQITPPFIDKPKWLIVGSALHPGCN